MREIDGDPLCAAYQHHGIVAVEVEQTAGQKSAFGLFGNSFAISTGFNSRSTAAIRRPSRAT
ncbi:MAG: hypothetical protein LAP21_14655 [Acidobacteriia bacterium]|nr:hypothetical protein [Terriglobia bacterium]